MSWAEASEGWLGPRPWATAGCLTFLFYAMAGVTDHAFVPALTDVARSLRLGPRTAGATLLALGNGAADVGAVFAGVRRDVAARSAGHAGASFGTKTGLGDVLGSGSFLCTVVAGAVLIAAGEVRVGRQLVRELGAFLLALAVLVLCAADGRIDGSEATLMVAVYIAYTVNVMHLERSRMSPRDRGLVGPGGGEEALPLTGGDEDEGDPDAVALLPDAGPRTRELVEAVLGGAGVDPGGEEEAEEDHDDEGEEEEGIDGSAPRRGGVGRGVGGGGEEEEGRGEDSAVAGSPGASASEPLLATTSVVSDARSWGDWVLHMLRLGLLPVDVVVFAVIRATVPVFGLPSSPWEEALTTGGRRRRKVLYVLDRVAALVSPAGVSALAYGVLRFNGVSCPWEPFALLAVALVVVSARSLALHGNDRSPAWLWMALTLVGAVAWVHVLAELIVHCLTLLSAHLPVSASVLALTLLTWGNSVPDLVADLSLARSGHTRMALAGAFAGPFFNLTVGLGLPVAWANWADPQGGWAAGGIPMPWDVSLSLATAFLALVLLVTAICGTRWKRLGAAYGVSLIAGYFALMVGTALVQALFFALIGTV